MSNLAENGTDHDSGDDGEEDSKESNIKQQFDNCGDLNLNN